LLAKIQAANRHNQNLADMQRAGEDKKREIGALEVEHKKIEEEILRLQDYLKKVKAHIEEEQAVLVKMREQYVAAGKPVDVTAIEAEVGTAEATNKKIADNKRAAELNAKVAAKRSEVEASTKKIDDFDAEKRKLLETAKFPVEGLAFDANGVTFKGLPFEQASSAEQLRVSVAMGFALNPKLRVLLVRDGSLLDPASLKMVADMAAEKDGQVWLERVSEGQECSVIIEDGAVKQAAPINTTSVNTVTEEAPDKKKGKK
jgi:hypothetical protein